MDIRIDWQAPLRLTENKKIIVTDEGIKQIPPQKGGVYFFARNVGDQCIPFYIGKAANIQQRLQQHLNNKTMDRIIRGEIEEDKGLASANKSPVIKQGYRSFHWGFVPGKGSKSHRKVVEIYLIRHALEREWPLLNKKLLKVKTHKLTFVGDHKTQSVFGGTVTIEAGGGAAVAEG